MKSAQNSIVNSADNAIRDFFDQEYAKHERYWWRSGNRYSTDPSDHTYFNGEVLRVVNGVGASRALDIGAGEGADAIRLARLGFEVDAVEISAVACKKMQAFAQQASVQIRVRNESVVTADLDAGRYDVVVMNGLLHYVENKTKLLNKIKESSAPGALHIVSLFSTATPIPHEHLIVPVFPDVEGGVVEGFYQRDQTMLLRYERAKPETSHPGFADHVHSYIKLIVRLSHGGSGT